MQTANYLKLLNIIQFLHTKTFTMSKLTKWANSVLLLECTKRGGLVATNGTKNDPFHV